MWFYARVCQAYLWFAKRNKEMKAAFDLAESWLMTAEAAQQASFPALPAFAHLREIRERLSLVKRSCDEWSRNWTSGENLDHTLFGRGLPVSGLPETAIYNSVRRFLTFAVILSFLRWWQELKKD